jgi:hypothetical protein
MKTLSLAIQARDYSAILECIDPKLQSHWDEVLVLRRKFGNKLLEIRDLLPKSLWEKYFEESFELKGIFFSVLKYPSREEMDIGNDVQFRLSFAGDWAYLYDKSGRQLGFRMRKTDEKWFVSSSNHKSTLADLKMYRLFLQDGIRVADQVINQTRRQGGITEEELKSIISG